MQNLMFRFSIKSEIDKISNNTIIDIKDNNIAFNETRKKAFEVWHILAHHLYTHLDSLIE